MLSLNNNMTLNLIQNRFLSKIMPSRFLALFMLMLCFVSGQANAQVRQALVVGNSNYGSGFDLINPRNDAKAIAEKLSSIGYQVHTGGALYDLSLEQFNDEIDGFLETIDDGASVLVYYAGHGAASDGSNYLIPILPRGVKLRSGSDIRDRSVSIEGILERVENSNPKGVNVFFIDACRDTPVSNTRSINLTGLTALDSRYQPRGSFIGFSTEYGKVAEDGVNSDFSPFAEAVLNNLDKKASAPIELFYKGVSEEVYLATGGKQYPIQEPKIRGDYCLVKCDVLDLIDKQVPSSVDVSSTNAEVVSAKELQGLSISVKVAGALAAILITGLLVSSGGSGSGGGYQLTLTPPSR